MKKLNKISSLTMWGVVDENGDLNSWMDEREMYLHRYKKWVPTEKGCRVAKLKVTIEEWNN